jgi:hypothetical protein
MLKQDPTVSCLQEAHLTGKDTETENEMIKKYIPSKETVYQEALAIFLSDKVN